MRKHFFTLSLILFALILFQTSGIAETAKKELPEADKAKVQSMFGNLPLYFIENQGQIDNEDVSFYVKGSDKTLYFTSEGITFALTDKDGEETKRWTVKLEFVGANPDCRPRGEDKQAAVFSYFKGKQKDWKTGLSTYTKIVYEELWPGIDLVYKGSVNQLKYEFLVKPGADPGQIRLAYHGATNVNIKKTGELIVSTPVGDFEDQHPFAYQEENGKQAEISMSNAYKGIGEKKAVHYGFILGEYDPNKTLILDPAMLLYCGYIGGTDGDYGSGIAVDDAGNAYVVGHTSSSETSFPVIVGPDLTFNGGNLDAFVAKVNASGTSLAYCGYIGGNESDYGHSIAVDGDGNAYVTGQTNSDESSFPLIVGPDLEFDGDYSEAFVAKVNASGTGLTYCGYIGGAGHDGGSGIAVDEGGAAYVTGSTEGLGSTIVGPDRSFNGGKDAFVAKVYPSGTGFSYCGYIGGSGWDYGYGIAVDGGGNAYVTGLTDSSETDFPVIVGPDLTFNGGYFDAFVAKVNASGTGLSYCGYIGGNDVDSGYAIAVNEGGAAYLTGNTISDEASFPVTAGPDLTHNGAQDAFVAKVNASGTGLSYCGYIGGINMDLGHGIAVDEGENAYVMGQAGSDESSFPVTVGPDLTFNGGSSDAFVAKVNASGTGLSYCGYIGGETDEYCYGMTLDGDGNAYVTGATASSETSFPVILGPDLTFNGGTQDAFVAKVPPYKVLLRRGNVNAGAGDTEDVLFVNGSAGETSRVFSIAPGEAVIMTMDAPSNPHPQFPGNYALYLIHYEPGPTDIAIQPFEIGASCIPLPLSKGNIVPPPNTIVNNIGFNTALGYPALPGIGAAPSTIFDVPGLPAGTYTFQGYIFDNGSSGPGLSLTNAIVLKVQ